jgi:hypothetical protein
MFYHPATSPSSSDLSKPGTIVLMVVASNKC